MSGKDQAAIEFEQLFHRTYPRVLAYLVKVSGQQDLAEDLTQNIYLQLWEHQTTLPHTEQEQLYYLFTIARNSFFRYTRKSLRERQQHSSFTAIHFEEIMQPRATHLSVSEQEAIVAKTLAGMNAAKVKYFRLNRETGLSYRQIAEQEGVSTKTVERYVGNVSRTLREKMMRLLFLW